MKLQLFLLLALSSLLAQADNLRSDILRFECPQSCRCSRLFEYNDVNCVDPATGEKTLHLQYVALGAHTVKEYATKLIINCYYGTSFVNYMPQLSLLPEKVGVQFHRCYPKDVNITLVEERVFGGNGHLRHVYLSGYKPTRLDKNELSVIPTTTELTLFETDIEEVDESILTGLPELERFYFLYNRKLTHLPPDIFHRGHELKKIIIKNEVPLRLDPNQFANLPGLNYVEIESELTEIPANIFKGSTGLETINLIGNYLTAIPHGLFTDQSLLRNLILKKNLLIRLDDDVFDSLRELVILNLSNNKLAELSPRVLQNLNKLEVLLLNHNRLTTLPDNVFPNPNRIVTLNLAHNRLNFASKNHVFLEPLNNLQDLNLEHNQIVDFGFAWISGKTHLSSIDLTNNRLNYVNLNELPPLYRGDGPKATDWVRIQLGGPFDARNVVLPRQSVANIADGDIIPYRVTLESSASLCQSYKLGDAKLKRFLLLTVGRQKC